MNALEPDRLHREEVAASIWSACWRTNSRHERCLRRGAGRRPRRRSTLRTVPWEQWRPSFISSPWIRVSTSHLKLSRLVDPRVCSFRT